MGADLNEAIQSEDELTVRSVLTTRFLFASIISFFFVIFAFLDHIFFRRRFPVERFDFIFLAK